MLIFIQLSKADSGKEQAVRRAFKQQFGVDPVIAIGEKSTVTQVQGRKEPQGGGDAEQEWVKGASAGDMTVESANHTLRYCLATAAAA